MNFCIFLVLNIIDFEVYNNENLIYKTISNHLIQIIYNQTPIQNRLILHNERKASNRTRVTFLSPNQRFHTNNRLCNRPVDMLAYNNYRIETKFTHG